MINIKDGTTKMSKILATVNGIAITEDEVNELIAGLGPRGQAYNNPEGRQAVLGQLIASKLLLIEARANLYETEPAFKAELARVRENLLISYATDKAVSGVTVTDEEVKAYYDANKQRFVGEETVNASHILVKTEDEAKQILDKIKAGEISFEDAARQYSTCPSGANGGSLGDFGKGQMVPEFEIAAFNMEVGEIKSIPVQTQFGYHLIKLNAKNPAQAIPLSEIAGEIKEAMLSEKRRAAYERKINQLKILYPVDIMS